jgi:uncharacterized protein with NRDE domain
MCLILLAYQTHPDYPLVLAANRDESYARPAAPAAFWTDYPDLYGGRDLQQGGTWLGITRNGRIAAVTNFRDGHATRGSSRTRGELVAGYLRGNLRPADYLTRTSRDAQEYNGFNLIAGNSDELYYFSNRDGRVTVIPPGVHGLSNHLLNTSWPKVERGKLRLAELLRGKTHAWVDGLFALLADRTSAPDGELPQTGVGVPRERILSPAFIVSPAYGTRSSTVILIDKRGQVTFIERAFGEGGTPAHTVTGRFVLESAPIHAA